MKMPSLLPRKFSSRIFLITLIAGLIPLVIFAVLIDMYGREFQPEIRNTIQKSYEEEWAHSEAILKESVATLIQQKASDVALQINLVLRGHPYMTLRDLQLDREFRRIAIQSVGKTGHTGLLETKSGSILFHKEKMLQNKRAWVIKRDFPELWSVIRKGQGGKYVSDYYDWKDQSGETKQKFMAIAPVGQRTADNVSLSAVVTASVEEFSNPIREAEAIHRKTATHLDMTATKLFHSFRQLGFFYMGLGILLISVIAFGVGSYFSRTITRLREATQKINEGDLSVVVKPPMSGEVKTLTEDFNRMIHKLAETTVSKRLLEESEHRLVDANQKLEREAIVRMAAERVLATEKEQLAITLRSIGDGVITADRQGKVVLVNKAAETLTGWYQSDATGRSLKDVFQTIDEKTRAPLTDPVEVIMKAGETISFEGTRVLVGRDRSERIVSLSGAPIRDNDNKTMGVAIVFRDVTGHRAMEEQMLKIRKLESVGTLAGGISHDFNNLLAIILGNISFAKALADPSSKIYQKLIGAENAVLKGKDLTYRLLTFSKGGEPLKKPTPLEKIIEESTKNALRGANVNVVFAIPQDLSHAKVDARQMGQVIYDVVMNAREAMPEGGTIEVRGENISLRDYETIPLPEGEYIKLSIVDRGVGISDEALPRIFDPYFTAKEMGSTKGMGLGLAISHSIVANHGGFMTAKSQVGQGTTIQIYLPACKEKVESGSSGAESAAHDRRIRVLYMDDEAVLRDIMSEMLDQMGLEVNVAMDGTDALDRYSNAITSGNPFDLVILDLTVPGGMGGKEAMQRLRAIDPNLKAIVSSGYSDDPILQNYQEFGFSGILVKPYNFEELGRVLEGVMNESAGQQQDETQEETSDQVSA